MGGSPGQVVMGGDSDSRGCGFESQHQILQAHFLILNCCKNCYDCLKKIENKRKRGREWPILKKYHFVSLTFYMRIKGSRTHDHWPLRHPLSKPLFVTNFTRRKINKNLFQLKCNLSIKFERKFIICKVWSVRHHLAVKQRLLFQEIAHQRLTTKSFCSLVRIL